MLPRSCLAPVAGVTNNMRGVRLPAGVDDDMVCWCQAEVLEAAVADAMQPRWLRTNLPAKQAVKQAVGENAAAEFQSHYLRSTRSLGRGQQVGDRRYGKGPLQRNHRNRRATQTVAKATAVADPAARREEPARQQIAVDLVAFQRRRVR